MLPKRLDIEHMLHYIMPERCQTMLTSTAEDLATPNGDLDPAALAEMLKLSLTELAQLAGVSRNSLRSDMLGPKARSALEPIVQIISAATEMMGNSAKAAFWFRYDPMIGMGTQTAMEHVAAGRGPQVLLYLRNIANGGYA